MDKRQTSNISFSIDREKGIKRCACGNTHKFKAYARSYDDGTEEHDILCEECRRDATAAGDISEAIRAFNEMNDGAIPLRFVITSIPKVITIYSKSEDDVEELIENELHSKVRYIQFSEGDFYVLMHKRELVEEADIVINNYAFKRHGDKVEVIDLSGVNKVAPYDPYMEMLLDGTILSHSQTMQDLETPQKLWKKLRQIDLLQQDDFD